MNNELFEIYQNHSGKVSDKWSSYIQFYWEHFQSIRNRKITILEIGVQNGGSLEIWSKFFPLAEKIVGIDIDPKVGNLKFLDDRIEVFVADASSDEIFLEIKQRFPNGFDLILDDGSHKSSDVIKTFSNFFDILKYDGWYVAEDLHCSYWSEWEGGVFSPVSSIKFFKDLVDSVNYEHWGVNKNRIDLFKNYRDVYGVTLNDDLLKSIHSIEFYNSICSVKKRDSKENILGSRFFAGSLAIVREDYRPPSLESYVPDQYDNIYANFIENDFYYLKRRISDLDADLNKYKKDAEKNKNLLLDTNNQLNAKINYLNILEERLRGVESSRSWKYTRPIRMAGSLCRLAKSIFAKIQNKGGLWPASRFAFSVLKVEGLSGVRSRILAGKSIPGNTNLDHYSNWIQRNEDSLSEVQLIESMNLMDYRPLISIVMPVFNPPIDFLKEAVKSLDNQIYDNWELCIADDASTDIEINKYLEELSLTHSKVKVIFREVNGHISAATNSALELASGEFVGLMDNDDVLHRTALAYVVKALNENKSLHIIYSDEDKIDTQGRRYDPYFKSDFNYELFLSQNMISHFGVYRKSILESIGGFRVGLEGAQDWDLALRFIEKINISSEILHIPKILYHWRAFAGSTALAVEEKPYVKVAQLKAVNEHLLRIESKAEAFFQKDGYGFLRVKYHVEESLNKVSIIIPTKDKVDLLKTCIESILQKTIYKNYEIIVVNNNSCEKKSLNYFEELKGKGVQVIDAPIPFNYSRLNNLAAECSSGNILCLMNNDIEIIDGDWMREMVSFASRPDIGCVGAKLLYPNDTVQHAGVILGLGSVAGHAMLGIEANDPGYFGRAVLHQSYSAVTGACLMVKKEIYQRLGGLEEKLAVAFNDIDFCIRVRELGFRNVWTPFALMYHHESASRGAEDNPEKIARFNGEVNYMMMHWGDILEADPAYSPNLSANPGMDFKLKI